MPRTAPRGLGRQVTPGQHRGLHNQEPQGNKEVSWQHRHTRFSLGASYWTTDYGMQVKKPTALENVCPYWNKVYCNTAISILSVNSWSKNWRLTIEIIYTYSHNLLYIGISCLGLGFFGWLVLGKLLVTECVTADGERWSGEGFQWLQMQKATLTLHICNLNFPHSLLQCSHYYMKHK